MIGKPATPAAYDLMLRGTLALADVEAWGMRIDVPYLHRAMAKTAARIAVLEQRMRADPLYRRWQRKHGQSTNLGSRPQLGGILYGELGYEPKAYTAKTADYVDPAERRAKVDHDALADIDLPFVKWFIEAEKLKKLHSTNLQGVLNETEGDIARPFFHLHNVRTFRSAGSDFNFQNLPIRDPLLGKIIRRAFIARDGHRLVELDYGSQEVRVAGCYCKDQKLIHDTVEGDMHRDMAAECFIMPKELVGKRARQEVKSKFVFAQFYGDWYQSCARNLWGDIEAGLENGQGHNIKAWLADKGITELGACGEDDDPDDGTFFAHIKAVEDRFWNERFHVYGQWRRDWVARYKKRGWFPMLTGFVCRGQYGRNDVMNYPIQGSAFHCLLWSLIELVHHIKAKKLRSRVVGQIHDSMLIDAHESELDELLNVARRIMTVDIVKAWPWIIVPLVVEADVAPAGGSWYDKHPYEIAA